MEYPINSERDNGKEATKNLVAGGMGALIARAVCQPLDVTKVRLQVYPNRYRSMTHAIVDMYNKEGIRGLWKGHMIGQISGLFQGAIQFFLYEQFNYSLGKTTLESYPNIKNFVCGFLTGSFGVIIISPLEIVKTQLITQEKKIRVGGPFKIIREIFQEEGMRGVYKGSLPATLQVGPLIGTRFMLYNYFCTLAISLTDYKVKNELPGVILMSAGAGAGMISNIMTYPVDVVKRRMQIHGFKGGVVASCNKLTECFVKTINEDGPSGLFKGIKPTIIKSAITTSLTFSAFDKIKAAINKLDKEKVEKGETVKNVDLKP